MFLIQVRFLIRRYLPFLMAGIVFGIASLSAAATIYVDGSRNVSGNGSSAQPYNSIASSLAHGRLRNGDVIRIRGGSGAAPILYNEESLNVTIPGLTITNWPSDAHRPAIMGSLDLNPAVNAPRPLLDVFTITAARTTISNLQIGNAWYCGIAVRYRGSESLRPAQMIRDINILNCSTRFTGSSGIYAKNARNIVVEGNEISRAVQRYFQECLTLANCYGFDINGNVVRDRPTGPGLNGGEGIDCKDGTEVGKIRNNRVDGVQRFGIYVDGFAEGCRNIEIFNNFVSNGGSGLSIASEQGGTVSNIKLHGNIVLNCAAGIFFGPHQEGFSHPVRNVNVYFNTLIRNNGYGINIANRDIRGLKFYNNAILDNTGPPIRVRDDVNPAQIRLFFRHNLLKSGSGFGERNIAVGDDTNQLFVQRFGAANIAWADPVNYAPLANSPAVDAGFGSLIGDQIIRDRKRVRVDIAGFQRKSPGYLPPGNRQDIGAREYYP